MLHTPYDLVASLLPLEFEEQLGRLFAIARTSFVIIPSSEDLDAAGLNPQYFSYWPSPRALIAAAAATARLHVVIDKVYEGASLLCCFH